MMAVAQASDRAASVSAFFKPASIAVIGASPREDSGGHRIFRNLVRLFDGPLYPIHPTADRVLGHPCYRTITEVPERVDLAVVFVPSGEIPDVVEDCVAAGVAAVCIEAGGFADAGDEGARLQALIADTVAGSGTRVWGPNCAGYVSTSPLLSTTFVDTPEDMAAGSASLVFQSGMAAAALLAEIASRSLLPIDKACSIGNKVDVDEADLLAYLAREGTSDTVALYLESIVDGGRLREALEDLTPRAMVCALMGNRTLSGLEAASTHTGALMTQSNAAGSFLRHNGVIEAIDFTELVDLARVYSVTGPRAGGARVGVLTFSGAAGVVAADLLEDAGLALARLSDPTIRDLAELFPEWYEPSNPVDVWSTVEQRGFAEATSRSLNALLSDDGVDAVIFVPLAFDMYDRSDIEEVANIAASSQKPVLVWPIGDTGVVSKWAPALEDAGMPVCPSLDTAVKVLSGFLTRSRALERHDRLGDTGEGSIWPEFDVDPGSGALDEVVSKRLMSQFGIVPVPEEVVSSREQAVAAARGFGYPVALKLIATGLAHKSSVGGVALDLSGGGHVGSAYDSLMATARVVGIGSPKVVVQPMVGDGVEVIVGARRDPSLGWMVAVGMGGVDVESLRDVAIRPAPITETDAQEMIDELRGVSILRSGRGEPGIGALVEAILGISAMTVHSPETVEAIEVNPLLVGVPGPGAVAVDGLITLHPAGSAGNTHESGPDGQMGEPQ